MFMKKFSLSWLSYLLIMIQLKNEKKFSHEMKYFNCCSKNKTQKKEEISQTKADKIVMC